MLRHNKIILTLIAIAFVGLFIYVWPQPVNKGIDYFNARFKTNVRHLPVVPFRLGLDLVGGTHLVYQANLSKSENATEALQGVRDVVERRVNLFGVSEPVVQVAGDDRLIVELAGISDVNQAIKLIGETPLLEFKTQLSREAGDNLIKNTLGDQTFGITADLLCAPTNIEVFIQFLAQYQVDPCFTATSLSGKHLQRADVTFNQTTSEAQVSLRLNEEGTKLFAQITRDNVGKIVGIYLDGFPISIPTVNEEIPTGEAVISGGFTPQDAKTLTTRLNSGALPVPIQLISQQTVGASLGQESLQKSLRAGFYSLIFVAFFMIFFYRLPGLVSVVALGLYILIVMALYKLIPVTLTLAGIAGFILTLGMAVDANVLIFARMKEELGAGKTVQQSVREGFRRAWLSIRDSHVTTLLSALVLYSFTTSIVKGFALTLGIGAIISLITATIVTRSILIGLVGQWSESKKWLFG